MTPQNKCVSLETAKKLKEAGFPQDTERRWIRTEHTWFIDPRMATPDSLINHAEWYSAPDAQEIMELLPRGWRSGRDSVSDRFKCYFHANTGKGIIHTFYGLTEAEARAQVWLYLKDNNLL